MTTSVFTSASLLYQAATGQTEWFTALKSVTALLGGVGTSIQASTRGTSTPLFYVEHGLPSDATSEYLADIVRHDARIEFLNAHEHLPIVHDHMILPEAELDRHPYYDFLRRHGFRYFAGIRALSTTQAIGWMGIQRAPGQGIPDARDMALAEQLQPHLQRAVLIATELARGRVAGGIATANLDNVDRAVLILCTEGRIMATSPAADRLLQTGDGLFSAQGRLRATRPASDAKLQLLVQGATMAALGLTGRASPGGIVRLVRQGLTLPLVVFVIPYPGRVPLFALERPGALVVVADPSHPSSTDPALLRDVFGLTAAEAALALLLAEGLSLPQIAERLAITVGTVRLHLHHVFRKTGARRQAELVALVLHVPRARPGDPS